MSIGFGALTICVLIGIAATIYVRFLEQVWDNERPSWSESLRSGAGTTGICAIPVLIVWFLAAVPISTVERTACEREADGYGLDGYDWSFRNGCRIELPTGQLVPDDSIRITSDGEIVGAEP